MAYSMEGTLLEVCTCNILCPCWVGEDPDNDGYCDAVMAWHIDRGTINGTDVSGLTMSLINHIPGNVLAGNWKVALLTLNESIFTTIPGAPAWVAKASHYKRNSKQYGLMNIDLQGHNAIQGSFRFEG